MSDFRQKLYEEKEQLSEKIDKLDQFLKGDTSKIDRLQLILLQAQLPIMRAYESIVYERILNLGKPE